MHIHIGSNLQNVIGALGDLSEGLRARVAVRTLNDAARGGRVAGYRAVAAASGLGIRKTAAGFTYKPANAATLQASITARGRYVGVVEFDARETTAGVSARPWNRSQTFRSAFIATGKNGNRQVFVRRGKARQPIKSLWGPSIARELERDASLIPTLGRIREVLGSRVPWHYSQALAAAKARHGV